MKKITHLLVSLLLFVFIPTTVLAVTPLSHPKFQAFDSNGDPLSGGHVHTYVPGTTTNKTTYSDYNLATPNANPVVLDSRGEASIFLDGKTKLVLEDSASTTIWTLDNIEIYNQAAFGYYLSDYADLDAAVTAIGATETVLWIDQDEAIDDGDTITIPATLTLRFIRGNTIDGTSGGATETLTINGGLEAKPYQIFGSNLTVNGSPKIDYALPEWWGAKGDDSTECATAINNAIGFYEHVKINNGTYKVTSAVTIDSDAIVLQGNGANSIIKGYGAINVVHIGNGTTARSQIGLKDFAIYAGDATVLRGIYAQLIAGSYFDNMDVSGISAGTGFVTAGIELRESYIINFKGGEVKWSSGHGIFFNSTDGNNNSIRMFGTKASANGTYGIYHDGGAGFYFNGDVESNAGGGVYVAGLTSFQIEGGYYEGNVGAPDIYVGPVTVAGMISGNYLNSISEANHISIRLDQANSITIENNNFRVRTYADWVGVQVDSDVTLYTNAVGENTVDNTTGSGALLGSSYIRLGTMPKQQSWTPVLVFSGGNGTVAYSASGKYNIVRGVVTFTCKIVLTAVGTASGNLTITGLPIPPDTTSGTYQVFSLFALNLNAGFDGYIQAGQAAGSSAIVLYEVELDGTATFIAHGDLSNTTEFHISGSYMGG